MSLPAKTRVAARFDRAAASYDRAAVVQRRIAADLAAEIAALGLPPGSSAAEFGCGVGYLAEDLLATLQPSLWVATDIAPAMVRQAARRLAGSAAAVVVMDADRPALRSGFDLVCSSLTLQWLEKPGEAVRAWRAAARPGGHLAVATLVEGAFAEWRAALAEAGVAAPGPAFPSLQTLCGWFAPSARVRTLDIVERHADALAFARAAKAAGVDAAPGRTLGPGAMRRALAALDRRGAVITYRVAVIVETV